MDVGRSPLPIMSCVYLMETSYSIGHFLPMDYYEDDFFLKLYCLIDNNNVSFYRLLMNENGYKEMSHS